MAFRPSSSEPHAGGQVRSQENPKWQAALAKYYRELNKGGIKTATIDKDLWKIQDPNELLSQIEQLVPSPAAEPTWNRLLHQLRPILVSLNDFAMLTALALGMNGKVAAVIWGSMGRIIKFAQPVLPDLVDMLEELHRALPQIRKDWQELPMSTTLEKALLDMYSEIIVFCAHAMTLFRNNPNIAKSGNAWSQFSRDFAQMIARVRDSSWRASEAAGMIRLARETHTAETVAVLQDVRNLDVKNAADTKLPCFMVPYGLNLHLYGRDKELQTLQETLDPSHPEGRRLGAVALYGLGGVGKSQLALHYANTSMSLYEVIAWVPSETQIKLVQAVSALASRLGLIGESDEDESRSVQKTRDWLNTCGKPYLLIFDNVEDTELLHQIWPSGERGSIIITTRSPSIASGRAPTSIGLEGFCDDVGKGTLYSLTGMHPADDREEAAAGELCRLLGGLPLAIVQVSGFIRIRGHSYAEFLELYKKSAEKVFAKSNRALEYEHTVLTTWAISLDKLSPEAATLQKLLAFFDPDLTPERLLTGATAEPGGSRFAFLSDEFDFGDAVVELRRTSFINRLTNLKALSTHRLVQFVVMTRMPKAEMETYFDSAVQILYSAGFPKPGQQEGAQQGHGWEPWETSSAILPHVSWLMQTSEEQSIRTSQPYMWAELVLGAGTYLWEREQPILARSFADFSLKIDHASVTIAAEAHRLIGHISLDIAQPRAGLVAYKQALALFQQLELPDSPPIADVLDSIAYAYTEDGDTTRAFETLDKATAIHHAHDPSRMARTLAIRAMACLRAGQADEALAALRDCWRLQHLTQEEVAASRYPKHSGDIVLLARIRWLQGERAEARQLLSRAIAMRRGVYGAEGGPRVADATFHLARTLEADGELVAAAGLLREVVAMCGDALGMRGHLARAFWFAANVEARTGTVGEEGVAELRRKAKDARGKIGGRWGEEEEEEEDTSESFMRLVAWMLW